MRLPKEPDPYNLSYEYSLGSRKWVGKIVSPGEASYMPALKSQQTVFSTDPKGSKLPKYAQYGIGQDRAEILAIIV